MTIEPESYVNEVANCRHVGGFYWSSEGLYRCCHCGASYENIRGMEGAVGHAPEHNMPYTGSEKRRLSIIEHARRFFGVRDNSMVVIVVILLCIAVSRLILDKLHVTQATSLDTILSYVGGTLALVVIGLFVWAKATKGTPQ